MYENEVAQLLYDNAEITPITYTDGNDNLTEEESELSPEDGESEDDLEEESELSSEADSE